MSYITLDIGLSEEQKDQVEKYIKKNFISLSHYEKKCEEYEDQIKNMIQSSKENEKLKEAYQKAIQNYDSLKVQYDQREQKFQQEFNQFKLDHAVRDSLKNSGAKYMDLMLKEIDFSKLSLKKDGSIHGIEDQIQELKKKYDSCFYPDQLKSDGFMNQTPEPIFQSATDSSNKSNFERQLDSMAQYLFQNNQRNVNK